MGEINEPGTIERVLGLRRWAVVGCSDDPGRPSNEVADYLISCGYDVVPVNPAFQEILGRRCYPRVEEVPGGVEVVDIFRHRDLAGIHVDEAIRVGAGAVWMQLGVIDRDAAERASAAGLEVVMDRCPRIELPKLEARRR